MNYRIAISVALIGCGGTQKGGPQPPPKAPEAAQSQVATASGPRVLVGWYCPGSAAGRPAVEPALARDPNWTASSEVLARAIGARRVKRFSVVGYQGQRSGTFAVAGAATSGGASLAIGSYFGASPCEVVDSLGKVRSRDEACVRVTGECSLAIGTLEDSGGFRARPYEEDPEADDLVTGTACEIGNHLVVDVDGDGTGERFSLKQLIAGNAPVELPLLDEGGRTCEAKYAAMAVDETELVRLGVIDLDGDGRPEVIYRIGTELFVYGAPHSPARMELLGRATLTSTPK